MAYHLLQNRWHTGTGAGGDDAEKIGDDCGNEEDMERVFRIICFGALLLFVAPPLACATQSHGGAEGLYVHQMSHLFFCISMGILIYWLKARGLTREPGWRYIGYAALMFLLWSLDAFTAHLLDEQFSLVRVYPVGRSDIQLDVEGFGRWLAWLYYGVKLDHLFCAPAMILFFLGLRRLSKRAVAGQEPIESRGAAE